MEKLVIPPRKPIEITLGEKTFHVRQPTLGQVRDILVELEAKRPMVEMAVNIVAIGLKRDNEDESVNIDEIEATVPQLAEAMGAILKLAGFGQPAPAEPAKAA